jgi:hypothetical protein
MIMSRRFERLLSLMYCGPMADAEVLGMTMHRQHDGI